MGEVVTLAVAPKKLNGTKHNLTWSITYEPASKRWQWQVILQVMPAIWSGDCSTLADAQEEVNKYLQK
jgi:hypothetical protein